MPANYDHTAYSPLVPVGSYPAGNGRWGHADLAGSMWEWALDWYESTWYTTTEAGCLDCANLTAAALRVRRGGAWNLNSHYLRAPSRNGDPPTRYDSYKGCRCAKSAP